MFSIERYLYSYIQLKISKSFCRNAHQRSANAKIIKSLELKSSKLHSSNANPTSIVWFGVQFSSLAVRLAKNMCIYVAYMLRVCCKICESLCVCMRKLNWMFYIIGMKRMGICLLFWEFECRTTFILVGCGGCFLSITIRLVRGGICGVWWWLYHKINGWQFLLGFGVWYFMYLSFMYTYF